MTTTDVVTPDAIGTDGGAIYERTDDPFAANRAALSPCPLCDANAHEGPEGEHWVQFSHCWRCGYDHTRPTGTVGGPQITLASGMSKQVAQQIAAEVHAALGLPEGVNLGAALAAITDAAPAQPAVAAPEGA